MRLATMAFSFGQPAGGASGGLFGSANPNNGQQASSATQGTGASAPFGSMGSTQQGGLFGGQNTTPQSGQAAPGAQGQAGGWAFGQGSAQSKPSGGLFGQAPAQNQPAGGLFGQAPGQSQPNGASAPTGQPSGGLFGQSTQPSGGQFGQSTQPQQGGLFGQATQPQQGGLFGQSSQAKPGGLFGSTAPSTTQGAGQPSSGFFGASTSQPFAQSTTQSTGTPAADHKLGAPLNAQLEQIRASWDTTNLATCQFQHYLYNRASDAASLQQLAVRRADAVGPLHDTLWAKAMQENPDPARLYPVLAVGFGDLQSRAQAQTSETSRQHAKLAELSQQLTMLQQKHDLANSVRAQAVLLAQARIHQRLLGLMKDGASLIPALRNQGLRSDEDQVLAVLESCDAQLNGPSSDQDVPGQQTRLRSQLNELWAQLGVVRAKRDALASQGRTDSGNTEWAVVDEASFEEVTSILASLQQGLLHLTNTLQGDTKALTMVCDGLKGVPVVGVRTR